MTWEGDGGLGPCPCLQMAGLRVIVEYGVYIQLWGVAGAAAQPAAHAHQPSVCAEAEAVAACGAACALRWVLQVVSPWHGAQHAGGEWADSGVVCIPRLSCLMQAGHVCARVQEVM